MTSRLDFAWVAVFGAALGTIIVLLEFGVAVWAWLR